MNDYRGEEDHKFSIISTQITATTTSYIRISRMKRKNSYEYNTYI